MKKQGLVVSRVEDFIKRIHDGDLVITYEAKTIMLHRTADKEGRQENSLALLLGNAMSAYQQLKDSSLSSVTKDDPIIKVTIRSRLKNVAQELLECIELAYTYGAIKEVKLNDKIKEYQEQNEQLKNENDKLRNDNLRLTKLNEALHQTIDKLGAKRP